MNRSIQRLLTVSLLASAGFAAFAQTPPQGGPGMGMGPGMQGQMMGPGARAPMDPAAMQERMRERHIARMAVLKDRLKLTAAQEPAWNAFNQAMQPNPQHMAQRRQLHAEMDKLTTPERIDRMRAMHTQRDAEMNRRAEATKTFYAALTPEQKKAFDDASLRHMGRGQGGHGGHGHGQHGGGHFHQG